MVLFYGESRNVKMPIHISNNQKIYEKRNDYCSIFEIISSYLDLLVM